MQTFTVHRSKGPSFNSDSRLYSFVRLFKFELIKVVVFLLLFAASVFIVNGQSEEYYKPSEYKPANIHNKIPVSSSPLDKAGITN